MKATKGLVEFKDLIDSSESACLSEESDIQSSSSFFHNDKAHALIDHVEKLQIGSLFLGGEHEHFHAISAPVVTEEAKQLRIQIRQRPEAFYGPGSFIRNPDDPICDYRRKSR